MAIPSFFGPEFVVNTTTAGFQGLPNVAALANGTFVVVWEDETNPLGNTTVRAQHFDASGAKVGSEFIINTNELSDARNPTVTALSNGGYVVAWDHPNADDGGDGSGSSVKAQIFDADGSKVGIEFVLNEQTALEQGDVSISALADGGFVASWSHNSGGGDIDVHGRIFNADGAERANEFAIDGSLGFEGTSSTVGLVGGGFVTVWEDAGNGGDGETDGSSSHIRGQMFDANGAEVGDEFVVNKTTLDRQFDPTVTALANGGFAVGWTHVFDTNDTDVRMRIFSATGAPQFNDVLVDGDSDVNEGSVSMVGLSDGNIFVAWQDQGNGLETDGSFSHIRGKVVSGSTGSDLTGEFVINTTTLLDQRAPSVTELTDGRVMVSWQDSSAVGQAANIDVRSQIIDPRTAAVNLVGTADADDWVGTAFADTLNGKGGGDRMVGGAGNDTYFVDNAKDVIIEAAGKGADTVATGVSYVLAASVEIETLRTTSNGGTTAIDLTGNGFAQTIIGNNGANIIKGGGGADTLQGLGGNDTYSVDNAKDVVIEGAGQGNDIVATSVSYVLAAGAEVETLRTTSNSGIAGIDLTGNAFAQTIIGDNANNVIKGGGGADTLQGLGGDDVYSVDNAKDVVIEGAGQGNNDIVAASVSYALSAAAQIETLRTTSNAGTVAIDLTGNDFDQTIFGNAGDNTLRGLGGRDFLTGLAGNDKLLGGDGDDDLSGGLGFDKMGGGAGKDKFTFLTLADSGIGAANADQITDFAAGDNINVSQIDGISGGGRDAFKLDAGGAFVAGEIHQTVSGGNLVLDFNVDGDTAAEMSVVLVGHTALLSATDFLFLT
ncbi:calcium-binding protein [Mesorhizobium sp. CN2-181]|uniref:calcium-binding protein n=1 Tax=Mesorhizobium yinganensis TaxID=3157707 RepID=UPI0032B83637